MAIVTSAKHERPLQYQPRPLKSAAPTGRFSQPLRYRTDQHQRQGNQDEEGNAECQADRNQAYLLPWSTFLEVVRTVKRPDKGNECRGTAPESTATPKVSQQSAILVIGEPLHLTLNQRQNLR
jgi:hypothetical protein